MNKICFVLISEKTKTALSILAIILIVLIIIFLILGLLGKLIELTMKKQGEKVDRYMTNLIISRVCDNPSEFAKIAKLKNKICFFRATITPLILGLISFLIWLIYHSISGNWNQSIFDTKTGILSLFYLFDFSHVNYVPPLGFAGIEIANTPHFIEWPAIINYFIFIFGFVSIVWFLVNVQAYIARFNRIRTLKNSIYSKDLSQIDITHFYNMNKINAHPNQENNEQNKTDLNS